MATNDQMEIESRMEALTTEQLLQVVRFEFADYRQEALALARQELARRGFNQSDMTPEKPRTAVGTDQPSNLQLTLFGVTTCAITFLLFPATIYYSVLVYGVPAAAFLLIGYGIWLFLSRTNAGKALAFAIGFTPPVALCFVGVFYGSAILRSVVAVTVGLCRTDYSVHRPA